MALQLKQLEGKPWYYGLGIGVVLGGIFYLIANFYFPNFQEMRRVIERKKGELNALNEKITQGRAAERRLPQLREEVRRIELDLQRLVQILPTQRNTEELIKKVEALTRQGDFFLKRFTPKGYINREFYAEWPIEVQLDATYHNLALFFARVARFSRIINVDDLVMSGYPNAPAGRTIGVNFVMKTFIYLGDQQAPAAAPPKGRPGGPRKAGG